LPRPATFTRHRLAVLHNRPPRYGSRTSQYASFNIHRTEQATCTTSTTSTHAEQATCRASTNLRQLRCTKDGQNDTVAATSWPEAATHVNYVADATGSASLLYPSRTHSANTTTALVSPQVFDQRSIWAPLSRNQGIPTWLHPYHPMNFITWPSAGVILWQ
jgi:hypothetical protein